MRLWITCIALCLIAGAAHAGPYRPITAKHFCVESGNRMELQFIASTDWGKGKVMRYLWAISCTDSACSGVQILLDRVDRGDPFGVFDISRVVDASMWRSPEGNIMITWGIHRWFIRPGKKDATYIAKASGDGGKDVMATAVCPTTF